MLQQHLTDIETDTQQEFDDAYALPYMRTYHPSYDYIPAIEEVKFSLISNRGCFGACRGL